MNPRGLSQSNWKSNRLSQVMFFFYFCHRRCSIAFHHLESSLFSFFESPSFFCFVFHRRKPLCEPQVTNLRMFFVAFLSGCFAFFVFFFADTEFRSPRKECPPLYRQRPKPEEGGDHRPLPSAFLRCSPGTPRQATRRSWVWTPTPSCGASRTATRSPSSASVRPLFLTLPPNYPDLPSQ